MFTHREWEECIAYENEIFERELHKFSEELGIENTGVISLSDAHGAGLKTFGRLGLMRRMNEICAQNYPEIIQKIVLFNTPWIFPKAFQIVKNLLDPITLSKFEIYSTTPYDSFVKLFQHNHLPVEYGGKSHLHLPTPVDKKDIEQEKAEQ